MRIQPIIETPNRTTFRSAYPVVHWLAESNGSYAPVMSLELTQKLQRKLVTIMNSSLEKSPVARQNMISSVQKFVSQWDKDYSKLAHVRSFYDKKGGWTGRGFAPFAYLLTGADSMDFEEKLAKPLGELKSQAPKVNGKPCSAELHMALRNYCVNGLDYVKSCAQKFTDADGMRYGVHTKFEIKRNKKGEIKDFEFRGIGFCPESGEKNPFVRLGFVK